MSWTQLGHIFPSKFGSGQRDQKSWNEFNFLKWLFCGQGSVSMKIKDVAGMLQLWLSMGVATEFRSNSNQDLTSPSSSWFN